MNDNSRPNNLHFFLSRHTAAVVVLALVAVTVVASALGIVASDYASFQTSPYSPPGQTLLLGSDELGRSVGSRMIRGMQVTLTAGIAGTLGSIVPGVALGFVAGTAPPVIDRALRTIAQATSSLPSLLAMLGLGLMFRSSSFAIPLAISGVCWVGVFRVVRAQVQQLRHAPFVIASVSMGAGTLHLFRFHYVPHLLPTIRSMGVLLFAYVVQAEAVLSFLGLGPSELPSLGRMLMLSTSELAQGIWWPSLAASAPLTLLVLSAYGLSSTLRTQRAPPSDPPPF